MENTGSLFRYYGKTEKAANEIPMVSLSPIISRSADVEAGYQEVGHESLINLGEVSKYAFQRVANRCAELGLSRSGELREVFQVIQQREPVLGAINQQLVREATLVFEYRNPQVSDKGIRLAVKFNQAKRDPYQVSEVLLDTENKRIAVSTKKEVEGWFYDSRQAAKVEESSAKTPHLAVYNSDSCEYEEISVQNEPDVIARLKVAGVELQNRNSGEGLDRPFIEVCAYDIPTRKKVAEILRADQPLDEASIVKQMQVSMTDPTKELAKVKTCLAALYDQATGNLEAMDVALKNNDLEKAEKCKDVRASLESEINDMEEKQTALAAKREAVMSEPYHYYEYYKGGQMTKEEAIDAAKNKSAVHRFPGDTEEAIRLIEKLAAEREKQTAPQNPITVSQKTAQLVTPDEGVDIVDPLAETTEVEIPTDLVRADSEAAPVQTAKAKKEGQSIIPSYVRTPDSPTPDRAIDPHMKPAEYNYIKTNYVDPLTREEMKILLAKAGDPLEREDLPDTTLVELVLKNIFSKKIRLEDVMELPYRTGRKQKVVEKKGKTAQLSTAEGGGDFKVGDHVLVSALRRSGEVTDLKRVEQTDEIVYEVALHGVPEPKLFKAEALKMLTEEQSQAVDAGDVQNFPGTAATPGQSIVSPPAMPGSEIQASSATSRGKSFYRLGKKVTAQKSIDDPFGEPDDEKSDIKLNQSTPYSGEPVQSYFDVYKGGMLVQTVRCDYGPGATPEGVKRALMRTSPQNYGPDIEVKPTSPRKNMPEFKPNPLNYARDPSLFEESGHAWARKTAAEDKSTPVGKEPDKISREPQRKPGRGPSQADGVAKYHEAYNPRNLGSGFYKPVKTAERIIEDVTMRRYPDYQTAFNAWTKDWDDNPRREVVRALKWVKVDVEMASAAKK